MVASAELAAGFFWGPASSPVAQMVKNLAAMQELFPGSGRSPGEGNGYPLQYFCLENPMDRGAWWATVSPWGCKESDSTEQLTLSLFLWGLLIHQRPTLRSLTTCVEESPSSVRIAREEGLSWRCVCVCVCLCVEGNLRMWQEGVCVCLCVCQNIFFPSTNVWVANRDLPWR